MNYLYLELASYTDDSRGRAKYNAPKVAIEPVKLTLINGT